MAVDLNPDPNGYIVFCPCMGRFGNQADQFLGTLAFAHQLGRTLVLPHWIEYPDGHPTSIQVPFDTYFKVEPLEAYTKVILMDDFMTHIASKIWPIGKRSVFCFGTKSNERNTCKAKEGNPFGPYWDKFKIDFDDDVFYGHLDYDENTKWNKKFSSQKYPVLAFSGAPGSFPVAESNVKLHKYLKWSDNINNKADKYLKENNLENEIGIGLHMRNGVDFKRACEHIQNVNSHFFSSPQCLGYKNEHGKLTEELCNPSEKTIFSQLGKAIKKANASFVFVAADGDDMIKQFKKKFPQINFFKYRGNNPHLDLCLISKMEHAIVNCLSSFSAFAKRDRDTNNKTTEFWAFHAKLKRQDNVDEL